MWILTLKEFYKTNILNICGYDFNIIYKLKPRNETDEPIAGYTDHDKQVIMIADKLIPEQELSTMIHECLHAIAHISKVELSEEDVCRLESGLHNLFKHNTRICEAYLNLYRKESL